jgi:class 3 adenylate cyclase/ABC-type proline/glycine betaine transport system substrate-binding protein
VKQLVLLTKTLGRIGWYVPAHVLDENDQLDVYRAYRTVEAADIFATNDTKPLGRFMGVPSGWTTFDEVIIENLKLKLKHTIASEDDTEGDLLNNLEESITQNKPYIFYFWAPHQIFAKHKLVRVILPNYSESCYSKYNQENGLVDCDYPPEYITKLMSWQVETDFPDISDFVGAMKYGNEDQVSIMADASYGGYTTEEAACRWLQNHTDIWKLWMPLPTKATNTSAIVPAILVPVVVAAVVLTLVLLGIAFGVLYYQRAKKKAGLKFAPRESPVTIVFTDVQNSTLLWELEPKRMKQILEIHNQIMRRNVKAYCGYEVKTQGDSFMIAFGSVENALRCCLSIQQQLLYGNWPIEIMHYPDLREELDSNKNIKFRGPRVRMGIHTGAPDCVVDSTTGRVDYYGPMVNKSARVEAQAVGGSIYASTAFIEAVKPYLELNPHIMASYLGMFKLKGIEEEEGIFRIRELTVQQRTTSYIEKNAVLPISSMKDLFAAEEAIAAQEDPIIDDELVKKYLRKPQSISLEERRELILHIVDTTPEFEFLREATAGLLTPHNQNETDSSSESSEFTPDSWRDTRTPKQILSDYLKDRRFSNAKFSSTRYDQGYSTTVVTPHDKREYSTTKLFPTQDLAEQNAALIVYNNYTVHS